MFIVEMGNNFQQGNIYRLNDSRFNIIIEMIRNTNYADCNSNLENRFKFKQLFAHSSNDSCNNQ